MKLPTPLTQWLQQRNTKSCHRQLLVISGELQWAIGVSTALLDLYEESNILWVGNECDRNERISVSEYKTKLGREYDLVVFSCFSGFRANAAMAISGTIKMKGLMIMLCPELSEWHKYSDPEQINRVSFGNQSDDATSNFFGYLSSQILADKNVAILTMDKFSGSMALADSAKNEDKFKAQNDAVERICKVALGHKNRPLVLTADRGRGKSSTLGIAAAKLMQQSIISVWVTAPHTTAVEQVFQHCTRLLPGSTSSQNNVTINASHLSFKPIDVLLEAEEGPDLLLVDEASSIPINTLIKLATKYSRVVFCTTMHGYEGSGRGFEIRFLNQLTLIKPECKKLHLSHPFRWLKNDSLEQFWFSSLQHVSPAVIKSTEIPNQAVICQRVSQTNLVRDKSLLGSIFNLLITAHYQTSPDDLQRLLDSPESRCFVLQNNQQIIGVAQILEEGGKKLQDIAPSIASNKRRVKGHLVAQNLASSYNLAQFCISKQWRISRIAIDPQFQNHGYGSQLLVEIEKFAHDEKIEFLTTAFGANAELLSFWHRQGYLPSKLSLKKEVSSGEHSYICVKPQSNAARIISKEIMNEFHQDLLFNIDKDLRYLAAEVVIKLVANFDTTNIDRLKKPIIDQFISGTRNLPMCRRMLKSGVLSKMKQVLDLELTEQQFIVSLLIQSQQNHEICHQFKLTGKKEIETQTRNIITKLFTEPT